MDDKSQTRSPSNNNKDAVVKVQEVAEQARSVALERVDLVRDQAESAKAKAAERVRKLGHAVRKIGEHMRIEDQLYIAEHAQSASQRLESVASYIDDTGIGTLIHDAERVARRNTVWVMGGTFLLGLAAGRILKIPGDGFNGIEPEPVAPKLPPDNEEPSSSRSAHEKRPGRPSGSSGSRDGSRR